MLILRRREMDWEIKLLLLLKEKEKGKNKEKFIRKIHIYLLSNKEMNNISVKK